MPNKPHTSRPLLLTLASRFILVAFIPVLMIALLFRFYYEPLMRADIETRHALAVKFAAFEAEHITGVKPVNKDPEAYIEKHG